MSAFNRDYVSLALNVGPEKFDQPIRIDARRFFHFAEEVSQGLLELEFRHADAVDDLPANMEFVAWL